MVSIYLQSVLFDPGLHRLLIIDQGNVRHTISVLFPNGFCIQVSLSDQHAPRNILSLPTDSKIEVHRTISLQTLALRIQTECFSVAGYLQCSFQFRPNKKYFESVAITFWSSYQLDDNAKSTNRVMVQIQIWMNWFYGCLIFFQSLLSSIKVVTSSWAKIVRCFCALCNCGIKATPLTIKALFFSLAK